MVSKSSVASQSSVVEDNLSNLITSSLCINENIDFSEIDEKTHELLNKVHSCSHKLCMASAVDETRNGTKPQQNNIGVPGFPDFPDFWSGEEGSAHQNTWQEKIKPVEKKSGAKTHRQLILLRRPAVNTAGVCRPKRNSNGKKPNVIRLRKVNKFRKRKGFLLKLHEKKQLAAIHHGLAALNFTD